MADLRQSAFVRDDFQRADENPVLNTLAHPWITNAFQSPCQIKNHVLQGTVAGNQGNWAYWDGLAQSDLGGNVPEVWARVFPSYTFPSGTRMGMMTAGSSPSGYAILMTGGSSGWLLRKYTNGSFTTLINTDNGVPYPSLGKYQLMRLTSTHVEVWVSDTTDPDGSWSMGQSFADTQYRSDLYMWLGSTGNEDGWTEFGGGPGKTTTPLPLYIRRTHQRGNQLWRP